MTAGMPRQHPPPKGGHSTAPKRKRADTGSSNSAEPICTSRKRPCLTQSLCLSADDDVKILDTVNARYEVHLQSVISSSKIQQRVAAMLRHLTPHTDSPTTADPGADPAAPKTRVSILRAKATEAGKLVSIAEIAKRQIEKEQSSGDVVAGGGGGGGGEGEHTGRWFQYIALGEELLQRPRDKGSTIIEETIIGNPETDRGDAEEADEFEIMKTPFERAIEGRPLVRGVPVMSLFLSRSPIEELKRRYGEQTNIPTTPRAR